MHAHSASGQGQWHSSLFSAFKLCLHQQMQSGVCYSHSTVYILGSNSTASCLSSVCQRVGGHLW